MEIKTKYDIGERVYVLSFKQLYKAKIVDIRISYSSQEGKKITYEVSYKRLIFEADENVLFSSEEDFLDFAENKVQGKNEKKHFLRAFEQLPTTHKLICVGEISSVEEKYE